MCTWFPLTCALRDNHAGECMRPQQLDAAIANLTSRLDDELERALQQK